MKRQLQLQMMFKKQWERPINVLRIKGACSNVLEHALKIRKNLEHIVDKFRRCRQICIHKIQIDCQDHTIEDGCPSRKPNVFILFHVLDKSDKGLH